MPKPPARSSPPPPPSPFHPLPPAGAPHDEQIMLVAAESMACSCKGGVCRAWELVGASVLRFLLAN